MKYSKWIVVTALLLLTASESFPQQPAASLGPSHKYRTILTPAGAAVVEWADIFSGAL